jgi:hypothetical protein
MSNYISNTNINTNSNNTRDTIIKFSENTKQVSFLTSISLFLILMIYFLPFSNLFIQIICRLIIVILLIIAFIINIKSSSYILKTVPNLYTNPKVSDIRNSLLLSYVFTMSLGVLIFYTLTSF